MRQIWVLALSLCLTACVQFSSERGIHNNWNKTEVVSFTPGEDTDKTVLDRLGPPSQIIELKSQTVYYYMHEHGEGSGVIFIVYNNASYEAKYDRAVFFFNENGVLDHYSYSEPYESK